MIIERLSQPAHRLIRRMASSVDSQQTATGNGPPRHRRYLSDQPQDPEQLLTAAGDYVDSLDSRDYLYAKPFDQTPGNRMFFIELYQVLNMLRAMDLPAASRVLEVGCGPGWITEILAMMGFEVDALDPCQAMIDVARQRLDGCFSHHRLRDRPAVRFHCQSLESCELPDGAFDGALFHESLHHIVDEFAGLRQVHRMLKPGGIMGVSGEGVWRPGDRVLEQFLDDEMQQYGTLENPFTVEYLDFVLKECGFADVTRYEGVNGLFPVTQSRRAIRDAAMFPAGSYQNLTACKPDLRADRTTSHSGATALAELAIVKSDYDVRRMNVAVTAVLKNSGGVAWNHSDREGHGYVTLALRQGRPGSLRFREAAPRARIHRTVFPGESITIDHGFQLPENGDSRPWTLDLVNEEHYWFSSCGTAAVDLETPKPE